ncbi:MAG: hypothetical protein ACI9C3_001855, partial [Yoonia sp.]
MEYDLRAYGYNNPQNQSETAQGFKEANAGNDADPTTAYVVLAY